MKCGNEALNIADRQNAHNAAVAANAVVESRQDELNQKILTFSISHDNEAVGMYGHYALIKGTHTQFYRHPIKKFDAFLQVYEKCSRDVLSNPSRKNLFRR